MGEDCGIEAEVTDAVVDGLERARDEARALGHGYIGTEHLVIVFSEVEGSRAAATIHDQGADSARLRDECRRIFDESNWNRYVPDEEALSTVGVDLQAIRAQAEAEFGRGAVPMRAGAPGFTRRVKRILEEASARVERAGGQKADIDDVLAALLDDGDSVGVKVLIRAGIDVAVLREAL